MTKARIGLRTTCRIRARSWIPFTLIALTAKHASPRSQPCFTVLPWPDASSAQAWPISAPGSQVPLVHSEAWQYSPNQARRVPEVCEY